MRTYDGQKVEQYLISMLESKKAVEIANPQIKKAFEIYILMHLNIAMVREIFCVENPAGFRAKVKKMQEIANLVSEIDSGMFCRNYLYDSGKTEQ